MTSQPPRLPRTGPLPRPSSPAEAREVLKAEAFPAPDVRTVTLTATEFTSICPRTGQPDSLRVQVNQNVRGGIALVAVAVREGT